MNIAELLILSFGVAMDAFAVSIVIGFKEKSKGIKKYLIVGLYFGIFQALMPLIGFYFTELLAGVIDISAYSSYIAFALLTLLGLKMLIESFKKDDNKESLDDISEDKPSNSLTVKKILPLALATSIDALAIGVTLNLQDVEIFSAILMIGITTFLTSMIGVFIGRVTGDKLENKAGIVGGVILILIGVRILLGHFGIF